MNSILTSKRGWLVAPVCFFLMAGVLVLLWHLIAPEALIPLFDNKSFSPVELMTLPLFALLIPLVWLCSPFEGSAARRAFWNFDVSMLAVIAIIRETDIHKRLFAYIWPAIDASFKGTVFKMRFLTSADIPLEPKLFVAAFFAVFFIFTAGTLAYFLVDLVRGIFKRDPVSWTWAVFGGTSVLVLVMDRVPAMLRHAGVGGELLDKHTGSIAALLKVFEEGGEMMMALFALMAVLQAHLSRPVPREELLEPASSPGMEPV